MHPIQESLMNPKGKYRLLSWRVQWKKQVIGWNCTQVPEVFFHCEERREERERERSSKRKPLIMVVLNLTSMHLTAVKYVTWVITLLTNHRGVITNSSNRERGPVSDPTVQHISQLTTITRGFLHQKRNRKENFCNQEDHFYELCDNPWVSSIWLT